MTDPAATATGTEATAAKPTAAAPITGDMIKAVRRETRAGAIDCRQALKANGGDVERAIAHLREKRIGTPKKVWV